MNPPVATAVTRSTPLGFAPLYLWFVCWGVVGSLVLVWAAYRNAFGLTEDQVPPEFERSEETSLGPDGDVDDPRVD